MKNISHITYESVLNNIFIQANNKIYKNDYEINDLNMKMDDMAEEFSQMLKVFNTVVILTVTISVDSCFYLYPI